MPVTTEQAEWEDRPADHYLNRLGKPTILHVQTWTGDNPKHAGPDDATRDPEQDRRARAAASMPRNH